MSARVKLVIFGLSLSSSWGSGHATVWRGLLRAMAARGHQILFYERDQPFYALHRDLPHPPYARLVLYRDWDSVAEEARSELADADVVIVTSYCPEAIIDLLAQRRLPLRVFYDLDAPVTLARLQQNLPVEYIGPRGLCDYDLVLSFTGGGALQALQNRLGATNVAVLYGSVDPELRHRHRQRLVGRPGSIFPAGQGDPCRLDHGGSDGRRAAEPR